MSLSAILFIISVGFSIIIGLMRIVNLSHAAVFVLGAHIGIEVIKRTGNFPLGLLCGSILMGILGMVMERVFISRLYGKQLEQVLLTMGLMFIVDDLTLIFWGGYPVRIPEPSMLGGTLYFLGVVFPVYRLFLIGVGIFAGVVLWFILERSKVGAITRAGADNEEMVQAMGINIKRVFFLTFTFGAFLVGLAGVVASPIITMQTGMSMQFLTLAVVVITVGGMGSLPGVVLGSLFVGIVDSFGRALFPTLSYFTLFVPMVIVLMIRPRGLLGRSVVFTK